MKQVTTILFVYYLHSNKGQFYDSSKNLWEKNPIREMQLIYNLLRSADIWCGRTICQQTA